MLHAQASITSLGKPLISYDGAFLDGALWGKYVMLACVGMDGEDRDIFCSLSINPTEDTYEYEYHIAQQLKHPDIKKFLLSKDLCVITDQSKGLKSAIHSMLPQAHHRFCGHHILNNIRGRPL